MAGKSDSTQTEADSPKSYGDRDERVKIDIDPTKALRRLLTRHD